MGGLKAIRRQGVRALSGLALAATLAGLASSPALAADIRRANTITVGAGETINDDLYVFGGTVSVDGTVNGNLLAAGGNVTISGTVSRDVMVAGGNLTVNGKVGGSVRAAGGNVTVSGPVAGDVVVAGGTLNLTSEATVGRDLVITVGMATVAGPVARHALVGGGNVTLQNKVGGDVTAQVDQLRLDPGAQIGGNLDYTSRNGASIASGARVAGSTARHVPQGNRGGPVAAIIGWLQALVGIFALGLLLLLLFPGFTRTAAETLERSPLPSLGIGCAVLVATPIVALTAFVLGLIIGGWWIALFLVLAYLLAILVGYVVSSLLLGTFVFTRLGWARYHPILMLLGGLVILAVVGVIPVLGGLILLAAVVFGLGALSIALSRLLPRARAGAGAGPNA